MKLVRRSERKQPGSTYLHRDQPSTWDQRLAVWLFCGCIVIWSGVVFHLGIAYVGQSDFFKLREIKISGCKHLSPEEIISQAKLCKGMSTLAINLAEASDRLEHYPYISRAVLKRKFPDALEIYVEERIPRAAILIDDLYLVDERGDIFTKSDNHAQQLPVLKGLTREDLYRDRDQSISLIRTALHLLEVVAKEQWLNRSKVEIVMDKNAGLTLVTLPERTEVSLGLENFSEKLHALNRILEDLKSKGLTPKTVHLKSIQKAYVTVNG